MRTDLGVACLEHREHFIVVSNPTVTTVQIRRGPGNNIRLGYDYGYVFKFSSGYQEVYMDYIFFTEPGYE